MLLSVTLGCGHSMAGIAGRDDAGPAFGGRCPSRIPDFSGQSEKNRLVVPSWDEATLCRYRGYVRPGETGGDRVGALEVRRQLQGPALARLIAAFRKLTPAHGRRACGLGTGTRYLLELSSGAGEVVVEVSEVGCGWAANSDGERHFALTAGLRQLLDGLTS
jgi:hypothetical protein